MILEFNTSRKEKAAPTTVNHSCNFLMDFHLRCCTDSSANWLERWVEVKTMPFTLKSGAVNCFTISVWLLSTTVPRVHGKLVPLWCRRTEIGAVLPGFVCNETLLHCVYLKSWSPASTTGLVWHRGNLRAALYCYFTSPYTVFVLNDVLCDLVVFAKMMKASAWCAVLCDCCLPSDMRYYFPLEFPKRKQQL